MGEVILNLLRCMCSITNFNRFIFKDNVMCLICLSQICIMVKLLEGAFCGGIIMTSRTVQNTFFAAFPDIELPMIGQSHSFHKNIYLVCNII